MPTMPQAPPQDFCRAQGHAPMPWGTPPRHPTQPQHPMQLQLQAPLGLQPPAPLQAGSLWPASGMSPPLSAHGLQATPGAHFEPPPDLDASSASLATGDAAPLGAPWAMAPVQPPAPHIAHGPEAASGVTSHLDISGIGSHADGARSPERPCFGLAAPAGRGSFIVKGPASEWATLLAPGDTPAWTRPGREDGAAAGQGGPEASTGPGGLAASTPPLAADLVPPHAAERWPAPGPPDIK